MIHNFNLAPDVDNYCVFGNPVAHSKSPLIHQTFARQCGQQIYYQAIQVDPDGFTDALEQFRDQGGKGLNITLPFKGDAWAAADVLTEQAQRAGSVNTIHIAADGRYYGDTTDGIGLVRDFGANRISLRGKGVLLLGAGGAVRGVLKSLHDEGPERILIVNRTASRAQELVEQFREYDELATSAPDQLRGDVFDVVINGTSASLQGKLPLLEDGILAADACCYDMAYGDGDTVFIQWARTQGAGCCLDGLGMLVEQAAESFCIWRGMRPDTGPVIEMLRRKQ